MTWRITGGLAPIILGLAPQPHPDVPRETPLELWERLRTGRPDRFAAWKLVNRAVGLGLLRVDSPAGRSPGPAGCGALSRLSYATSAAGFEPAASAGSDPTTPPPWLAVNPDGWTGDTLLIVKVYPWVGADAWEADGPPPYLVASVQHELLATGQQRARVGVLLAGNAWRPGWMRADQQRQAALLEAETAFVDSLERGVPPEPTDEADLAVVKRLFPEGDGARVTLPAWTRDAWERCKDLRRRGREMATRRATLEARLRMALGPAGEGVLPGGHRLALRSVPVPGGRMGRRLVEVHRSRRCS